MEATAEALSAAAAAEEEEEEEEEGGQAAAGGEEEEEARHAAGALEFSALLQQSAGCVSWSPTGSALAVAVGARLAVREAESMQILVLFSCVDKIDYVEWSPDGEFLLCAMYKRSAVQVLCLADAEWSCRINEGLAGLVHARWAPDSRHVLTLAEFNLQLNVWPLVEDGEEAEGEGVEAKQQQRQRQQPQPQNYFVRFAKSNRNTVAFSPDGAFLAVAIRKECKDFLSIFDATTWTEISTFRLSTTDVESVVWTADSATVVAIDCNLQYHMAAYSLSGECVAQYQAYEHALGIKTCSLSPETGYLAIGSYDQAVRLVTPLTWRCAMEYPHRHPKALPPCCTRTDRDGGFDAFVEFGAHTTRQVTAADTSLIGGLAEPSYRPGATAPRGKGRGGGKDAADTQPRKGTSYVCKLPSSLPEISPDPRKPNPRLGIGLVSWSHDGRFLVTRNDNMPTVLWIWDTSSTGLCALLIQAEPIRAARWSPIEHRLAFCTGNSRVYFWTERGASWVDAPDDGLHVGGLRWHGDGTAVALLSKDRMCVCYIPIDPARGPSVAQLDEGVATYEPEAATDTDVGATAAASAAPSSMSCTAVRRGLVSKGGDNLAQELRQEVPRQEQQQVQRSPWDDDGAMPTCRQLPQSQLPRLRATQRSPLTSATTAHPAGSSGPEVAATATALAADGVDPPRPPSHRASSGRDCDKLSNTRRGTTGLGAAQRVSLTDEFEKENTSSIEDVKEEVLAEVMGDHVRQAGADARDSAATPASSHDMDSLISDAETSSVASQSLNTDLQALSIV